MRQLKISKQVTSREALSLDKYLSDVAKIELISPQEEVELARRIKAGDQRALDKLTKSNLRFVISVAKQYQNQGLALSDLIEEGNLGLIKASKRFDETRGFKFISYAVWWIRQSILQALAEQARVVRLPLNKIGSISKVGKAFSELEQKLQRPPSAEEIAEHIDVSVAEVRQVFNANGRHLSLDAPVLESDEVMPSLYDLLSNDDLGTPESSLLHQSLQKEINRSLNTLTKKEADIVKLFYGLDGCKQLNLDEIGSHFELSRERVRQIKENAVRRLRYSSRSKLLRPYLG